MRGSYGSSERQRSRQRGFKDGPYGTGRDISPDMDPYNRAYSSHQFSKKKRVKFNDQEDIRVFKKQDQPIAKNLSEEDIFQVKQQIEKQISRIYDFNWDQKKHFDALSEQNSMKEQKQKEKQLYEKLMGMKEETQFYAPYALALPQQYSENGNPNPEAGSESIEKEAHSERIKYVLGCYYTQASQIPNEPTFEVSTPCNKNEPKIIRFNPGGINQAEDFATSSKFKSKFKGNKNQKQLKGILKMPGQQSARASTSAPRQVEQRQISPRLLWLLKDIQVNKQKYNKQMTELLLKPYKDSGQLDYWMSNQELLNEKLKNQPVGVQPPPSNIPVILNTPPVIQPPNPYSMRDNRMSPSPSHDFKPHFVYDPNLKAEKYKTVPCKYFHSPQGCVKTQNCTFIHDQKYRGVSHPLMLRPDYRPFPTNFGNVGGYQEHGGHGGHHYHRKNEGYQPYGQGQYGQNPQHRQNYGMYKPQHQGHQNYQQGQHYGQGQGQGGYQQQNRYQNYNPQGPQQGYPPQMGQMNPQQPQTQPYQNYQNPQQMYYNQGQGGSMQPRGPNER